MKFGANRSQLYDAQKTARIKWDQTEEAWTDATRQEFEERLWIPLDQHVSTVLRSVDQLTTLFAQVRQECEYNPFQ